MEFITILDPSQKSSTVASRRAHSHAARVAHARARRIRTEQYMQQKKDSEGKNACTGSLGSKTQEKPSPASREEMLPSQPKVILSVPRLLPTAFEHEPLASFLRSLTFRERFMFDHYVKVFAPQMQANCPVLQCLGGYHDYMRANWVLVSSTDLDLLRSFLLAACRHLSFGHLQGEYAELATQYKLRCIQDLRQGISLGDLASSRRAVTRTLVLAFDDIMLYDTKMAAKHILGAIHIIKAAGGIQALGLSDIVRGVLYSCIYGKELFDDPEAIWT